jgi:hypothetical protein
MQTIVLRRNSVAKDLTNRRFGRLVAIRATGTNKKGQLWECDCDCGNICSVPASLLLENETQSCGCLKEDQNKINLHPDYSAMNPEGTNLGLIKTIKINKNNSSGKRGVTWHKGVGMWLARIQFKKKTYYLGYRNSFKDACDLREQAEKELFGNFLDWYEKEYKVKP